jgi:glutathione S-transferase
MKLVIGNKRYSSWSLRPWIALVEAGIPFDEEVIPLGRPDTAARIAAASPNGKVPMLIDGSVKVWESLAILDYLAERFPQAQLWPAAAAARAHARAIASEMHAGFAPMRAHLPMNFGRSPRPRPTMPDDVKANVARVTAIWREACERSGGPFLFGARFGAADAMYAPVVHRLHAYAVAVDAATRAYMDAVMGTKGWMRWDAEAANEPADWRVASSEVD